MTTISWHNASKVADLQSQVERLRDEKGDHGSTGQKGDTGPQGVVGDVGGGRTGLALPREEEASQGNQGRKVEVVSRSKVGRGSGDHLDQIKRQKGDENVWEHPALRIGGEGRQGTSRTKWRRERRKGGCRP